MCKRNDILENKRRATSRTRERFVSESSLLASLFCHPQRNLRAQNVSHVRLILYKKIFIKKTPSVVSGFGDEVGLRTRLFFSVGIMVEVKSTVQRYFGLQVQWPPVYEYFIYFKNTRSQCGTYYEYQVELRVPS